MGRGGEREEGEMRGRKNTKASGRSRTKAKRSRVTIARETLGGGGGREQGSGGGQRAVAREIKATVRFVLRVLLKCSNWAKSTVSR